MKCKSCVWKVYFLYCCSVEAPEFASGRGNVWRHWKLVQKSTRNGVRQFCLHLLSSLSSWLSPVKTDIFNIWWKLKWLKMKILERIENLETRILSCVLDPCLSCSEHCKVSLPLGTSSSLDSNRTTLIELVISKTTSDWGLGLIQACAKSLIF